jgi:flagellin
MDFKGVGDRISIQPFEMRAGLETQKRIGKLGISRRIVTESDDPSGMGIAARMRARANSFAQSRRNATAGMDVARTAGGALSGVSEDLGRMRELATQAASGTLNDKDRASLDAEFQELKEGISDQLGAEFNGLELFSGETVDIVVEPDADAPVEVQLPDADDLANLDGLDVASAAAASGAMAEIDTAMEVVSSAQADLGAGEAALGSALQSAASAEVEVSRAESRISSRTDAGEAGMTAAELMRHAVEAMQIHQGLDDAQVADLLSAPF